MAYHTTLVNQILEAMPAVSVETGDRIEAAYTILTADIRALPIAWETLTTEHGRPPFRLDAWADAVDAAYLSGF